MKSRDRSIILYLVISVISSMDLTRGIFTLFLASRGVSPMQIGLLQTTLFWSNLLFELPTGIFADRTRRRTSLALGFLVIGASSLLMPFSSGLLQFLALFAMQGLGFSFRSGAAAAWLYDRFAPEMPEAETVYLRVSALCRTLGNIALAGAVALGPWLRGTDWSLAYVGFAALMFAAAALAFLLPETPRSAEDHSARSIELVSAVRDFARVRDGRRLLLFIATTAFLEAAHTPLFIFMQLKLKGIYTDERWVGETIASVLAFGSLTLALATRFEAIPLHRKIAWASAFTSALTFALALVSEPLLATALFCLANAIPSLLFVYTDKEIQERIPSRIRASFLSVHSLIVSLAISLSYLGVGAVIDRAGIGPGIRALAVLPLLSLAALVLSQKRRSATHAFA